MVVALAGCVADPEVDDGDVTSELGVISSGTTTPARIDSSTGSTLAPELAVDARGAVTAVWIQDANAWANRYVPGVGWGTATLLETAAGAVNEIQVAAGKAATTAVWTQIVSGKPATFTARFDSAWSAPTRISQILAAGTGTSSPVVAMDQADNAWFAWLQHDGTHTNLYSRARSPSWRPVAKRSLATEEAARPYLSASPNGNVCLAWAQSIPGSGGAPFDGYVIQASTTTWSAPIAFESRFAQLAEPRCGAFGDAAKTIVLAYRQWDGVQSESFYGRTYSASAGLGAETAIETDAAAGHDVDSVHLAVDGVSNIAYVAWDQHDGTNWRGYARRFAQAAWSATSALGQDVRPYALAANHEGRAVLAYWSSVSYSQRQALGMKWNGSAWTSFDWNAGPYTFEEDAKVVLDDAGNQGNATALWYAHDGQAFHTWAARHLAVDMDDWITSTPNIAAAISWQTTSTAVATVPPADKKAWSAWTAAEKTELRNALWSEWRWWFGGQAPLSALGETLADPPANASTGADGDYHRTQITTAQARALYIATVAHSIFVELGNVVPWSIATYDLATLRILFDSAYMMRFDPATNRYEVSGVTAHGPYAHREDNIGFSMLSPPRGTFARFTNGAIVGTTRLDSISRLLEWGRANMRHVYAPSGNYPYIGSSNYYIAGHTWQYRGSPTFSKIWDGTTNTTPWVWGDPEYHPEFAFDHWTGGCHHTTQFLRNGLRSINIPVVDLGYCGHSEVLFPTENLYLDHADNIHAGPMIAHPEIPMSSLLIDHATWVSRFGSNPDNNCDSNQSQWIGHRVTELVP
jgi:hypothetical protein